MDEKPKNGSGPKFDFSKVSRQWYRDFQSSLAQATRIQVILKRELTDEMSDEQADALLDRQEKALDEFEALGDHQAELLVQVLIDVPREWLLANAPDEVDWSKAESLDYIQGNRYTEILELMMKKDIAGEDSKNSDGHSRSRQKRRGR